MIEAQPRRSLWVCTCVHLDVSRSFSAVGNVCFGEGAPAVVFVLSHRCVGISCACRRGLSPFVRRRRKSPSIR